jgi:hypothetical protein
LSFRNRKSNHINWKETGSIMNWMVTGWFRDQN